MIKGTKRKRKTGRGEMERPDNTPHMYKAKKKQGKGASKIRQNNRTLMYGVGWEEADIRSQEVVGVLEAK